MQNKIEELAGRLRDKNYQILGFEALLFSGVFGAAYQSWIVFGAMLLGLCWMLGLTKGKVYAMVALSCLWGIIAASIGHSFGGWQWALACGLGMVLVGIKAHTRSLDFSVEHEPLLPCGSPNRVINHRWGRQNLN